MNSIDEIIDLYKRGIDVTLIDESLKLSVEERLQNLDAMREFAEYVSSAEANGPATRP